MAKDMLNRKQWLRIVTIALSTLSGVTAVGTAASAETFVVSNSNKALNTNRNFSLIDGHPRMSLWTHNINDADQHFDRLQGNRGGQLLRHRSTGKCLNAYRRWNGAEVNVYPCNANDPDQNFNVENLSNGDVQIRLSEIRNNVRFCIDSPTRNDGGAVTLWQCNSGGNQMFKVNGISTPPVLPDNGNVVVRPSVINRTFGRGAEFVTSNRYKFVFQQDGNLVLYTPQGRPIWATGTNGTTANMLAVQTDGNVVLYANGKPVWATDTAGNLGAYLAIQTDGNVVVYRSNNVPIFNTGTVGGVTRTFTASADWLNKANQGNSRAVQRAKSWVDRAIRYNQQGYFEGYRQDCSGLVSMAWELKDNLGRPISPVTSTLPQYANTLSSKSQLQPGDAINNRGIGNGGHVVLFVRWVDQANGKFIAYEQNGGYGRSVQTILTLGQDSRGFTIREYNRISSPWYLERKK